jgi:hypothetical protein
MYAKRGICSLERLDKRATAARAGYRTDFLLARPMLLDDQMQTDDRLLRACRRRLAQSRTTLSRSAEILERYAALRIIAVAMTLALPRGPVRPAPLLPKCHSDC